MTAAISVDRDPVPGSLGFVVVYSTGDVESLRLWGDPPRLFPTAEAAAAAAAEWPQTFNPAYYFLQVAELRAPAVRPPGWDELAAFTAALVDAGAAVDEMELVDAAAPSPRFDRAVAAMCGAFTRYQLAGGHGAPIGARR